VQFVANFNLGMKSSQSVRWFGPRRTQGRHPGYLAGGISLWPSGFSRSPYDWALLSEFEQWLEAALGEMPPIYREVLLLIGLEGLQPGDAAAVCGITPEALRQRLSRGRTLLSQRLKTEELSHEVVSGQVSL